MSDHTADDFYVIPVTETHCVIIEVPFGTAIMLPIHLLDVLNAVAWVKKSGYGSKEFLPADEKPVITLVEKSCLKLDADIKIADGQMTQKVVIEKYVEDCS